MVQNLFIDTNLSWTLEKARFSGVSQSITTNTPNPRNVFFRSNGLSFWIIEAGNDYVNEYSLSNPWGITSATYVRQFSVGTQENSPNGLFFSPDGLKMFVSGGKPPASIHEYTLLTAWDISTSSFVQSLDVSGDDTSPTGMFFRSSGLKLFFCGAANGFIFEYDLSAAWNISTALLVQSIDVSARAPSPVGIFFRDDGSKMFLVNAVGGTSVRSILEYNLSIVFDISTAIFVRDFSVAAQDTGPQSIFFNPDGFYAFISGNTNDSIYKYLFY